MSASTELIEQELGKIRGIIASRVVLEGASVREVHVLAALGRPVKHIVRDVEAVFATRFQITVDHRCISVAQIDAPASKETPLTRLILNSVCLEATAGVTNAAVQLKLGDTTYTGEAQGSTQVVTPAQLVATATIRAVVACFDGCVAIDLVDIRAINLAGHHGYAVAVSLIAEDKEEKLIGCALTHHNETETSARAVLNALNRRITALPPKRVGSGLH